MNEENLLINLEERKKNLNRIEVLEKVKGLLLLSNSEFATTEMVANYFNVENDTIKKLVERNNQELSSNGYRVLTGNELSDIKSLCQIKSRAKSLAIFSKRAILNVAMLLRDSKVAKEIRSRLLDIAHDSAEGKGSIETIVEEIDTETRLRNELLELQKELGVIMFTDDKLKIAEQIGKISAKQNEIEELKNIRITELETENAHLKSFLSESKIFKKSRLAEKLDTNTITLAKILKEEGIYTQKTCKVSETFKSKYPNIKITANTLSMYKDECGRYVSKDDWQWTQEGAYILIQELIKRGRVKETDNNQFKIIK